MVGLTTVWLAIIFNGFSLYGFDLNGLAYMALWLGLAY
jgi:hypothetical protein